MVWGMRLPDKFGEFWPDGEFEFDSNKKESGWRDRLRQHYLAQSPEEQIRLFDYRGFDHGGNGVGHGAGEYPFFVSAKLKFELGTKNQPGGDLPLTAINSFEPPISFDTEKTYSTLGSLIKLNARIMAVDEALKAIIEGSEPDVHQFFPIEIRMPKGKVFPKKYYTFVNGQYFNSYLPEKSDRSKKNFAGLVFSKEAFGRAHIWKDRGTPALTYFSDALKVEIDKAGLKLPKHYKMKEV